MNEKRNKTAKIYAMCPQTENKIVSTKTEIIKFRITKELKEKIIQRSEEVGKSYSELNRLLWENYFEKLEAKENQKDVEHFLSNYKNVKNW